MKKCSTCKIEKSYKCFSKKKCTKDGYSCQCKLCVKQYRLNNKDMISNYNKQYYINNFESKNKYAKQYRIKNVESKKQYVKEYYKTDHGRLVIKANNHKRKVLLKANTPIGKHWTPQNIMDKMKLQKGKCVYCQNSIKEYHEVDHIIPLCKGGSNESSNIQLLCQNCNGQGGKGSKDIIEFAQKYGMLF